MTASGQHKHGCCPIGWTGRRPSTLGGGLTSDCRTPAGGLGGFGGNHATHRLWHAHWAIGSQGRPGGARDRMRAWSECRGGGCRDGGATGRVRRPVSILHRPGRTEHRRGHCCRARLRPEPPARLLRTRSRPHTAAPAGDRIRRARPGPRIAVQAYPHTPQTSAMQQRRSASVNGVSTRADQRVPGSVSAELGYVDDQLGWRRGERDRLAVVEVVD